MKSFQRRRDNVDRRDCVPAWSQFSITQSQSLQQNVRAPGALPSQAYWDCLEANPARR